MTLPARTVALLVVAAGIAIRLWHFLANRSLFIDEARLALNIGTRGFGELFVPLGLEQVAPVPFLLLTKASVTVLGMHELSLRLVPLLVGCALLPLMWRLAQKLLAPPSAVVALSLIAFSPAMIRASNDTKPYGLDALVGIGLLLLGLRLADDTATRRSVVGAMVGAWAGVVLSFTGIIVAGVIVAVAGTLAMQRRDHTSMRIVALGGAFSFATAMVLYLGLYHVVGGSDYMQEFWAEAYLTGQFHHDVLLAVAFVWGWFAGGMDAFTQQSAVQLALRASSLAVVLAAMLGVWELGRTAGWTRATLLAGPIAVLAGLNVLRVYPSVLRLELFAVPTAALLLGAAFQLMVSGLGGRTCRWGAGVAAGSVLGLMLTSALVPRFWPYYWQELDRVAGAVPDSATVVYVNAGAVPAWAYYTTDWATPDFERLDWLLASMSHGGAAFENASSLAPAASVEALKRPTDRRVELLGGRTGIQIRPYDSVKSRALAGWAEREAARVVRETSNEAWLVFTNHRLAENAFISALERSGVRVDSTITAKGAAALHVRLSRP